MKLNKQMNSLLTRDVFRNTVFERDNFKCVICKAPAKDAHHIIERRLFDNGGYFISNGASLCEKHHIDAEMTTLSCKDIRDAAGIDEIVLPEHLSDDEQYDRWGNIILSNGTRMIGELFYDESVQKVLEQGGVLNLFTKYVKYPRTFHIPWSESVSNDDKMLSNMSCFEGNRVFVSIKRDGENASFYNDGYYHARSVESGYHKSRTWIKRIAAEKGCLLPAGWRVCAENLYATHSLHYEDLQDYILVLSIWNEKNICLSIDETLEWIELLDMWHSTALYDGIYDENKIKEICASLDKDKHEGIVIRNAHAFPHSAFRSNVAKWVRRNHVLTSTHWTQQEVVKNKLK